MIRRATVMALVALVPMAAMAQVPAPAPTPEQVEMANSGMTEALEASLRPPRETAALQLLAQAYTVRAKSAAGDSREKAFQQAAAYYAERIDRLAVEARSTDVAGRVRLAAARVDLGNLILVTWAAPLIDEYELTSGQRGDAAHLRGLLEQAQQTYTRAETDLATLSATRAQREEELFAAGVYDLLLRARLDQQFNLAWAELYLGRLAADETAKRKLLLVAERRFQSLIDEGPTGAQRAHCYLGVAAAQAGQGRVDEADRGFLYALGDEALPVVRAQARCEQARSRMAAERFEDARAVLKPLVALDPAHLAATDEPLRFYVNLAHVLDAHSYLREAETVRRAARDTPVRDMVLRKADQLRETGLLRFRQLAVLGEAWSQLVRLYVAGSVDRGVPPAELTAVELLYAAGELRLQGRGEEALKLLRDLMARDKIPADVAAEALLELGRGAAELNQVAEAAAAFERLATQYRTDTRAAYAAGLACRLRGEIAEHSSAEADYLALAEALRNLVEHYADHPDRPEATWLLPVALQAARHYDEAARQFAKLPADSPHAGEARYRRVLCEAQAVEVERERLGREEYSRKARAAATGLLAYARSERTSVASAGAMRWAADARVRAAELLADDAVGDYAEALDAAGGREGRQTDGALLARVLAVRMRAYRGLRQFEQAAGLLSEFLQTADASAIGATLPALADGMQSEVERLLAEGDAVGAKRLASEALATFGELERRVATDAALVAQADVVRFARARMLHVAGQEADAEHVVRALLAGEPQNGRYQWLLAHVRTAQLSDHSGPTAISAARDAWATLLGDPALRRASPEHYWEARYEWLRLTLRAGNAADVVQAITQERVWYPELGGPTWAPKFIALLEEARKSAGR